MTFPFAGVLARATLTAALLGAAVPAAAQGLAGPYLAASQADLRNDYAEAADYYEDALVRASDVAALVNNALIVNIVAGRAARSGALADALADLDPQSQLAALVQLADAFAAEDYELALEIAGDDAYGYNPLFQDLVRGWARIGAGDFAAGIETFSEMNGNSAMTAYGQLNQAFAHAFAGDFETAATLLDGEDGERLHLNRMGILTHLTALSQTERTDEALEIVGEYLSNGRADAELTAYRERLEAGETLDFTQIKTPGDGAAAAFALLADGLLREDAERLALIYGRLAVEIRPEDEETLILIGETLARQSQYDLAVEAFAAVAPLSPWYVSAEIGRADALQGAERADEAIEVLSNLAREEPEMISVHTALGDLLRTEDDFARASDAYSDAIALLETDARSQWRLYYVRGISYERTDRWDQAEADFRKALELNPDQPSVLNYLGYSLVELRRNLDEALDMIERAVAQRPQDGYITDSLGWVYYRLGRFEEAVAPMERAVELAPVDPVINDHLGDVLWMVGRKLEAEFQWRRALSFEPEEDEAERIRKKLDVGLDAVLAEEEAETATPEPETASGD